MVDNGTVMSCRLVPLDKGDRRRLLLLMVVAPLLVPVLLLWLPVVQVVPLVQRPVLLLLGGERRLVPRDEGRDVGGGDAERLGDLRNTLSRCCC